MSCEPAGQDEFGKTEKDWLQRCCSGGRKSDNNGMESNTGGQFDWNSGLYGKTKTALSRVPFCSENRLIKLPVLHAVP